MIHQKPNAAIDQNKLKKLGRKDYRDAYLQAQVRAGIAYQFQALRSKFGLSQTEMAERTGKTQSMVSRLESVEYGKVSVQTLLDVACSLDVALLVQFVSYPDFLARTRDKSESAMQPDTILESAAANDLAMIAVGSPSEFQAPFTGRRALSALDASKMGGDQLQGTPTFSVLSRDDKRSAAHARARISV